LQGQKTAIHDFSGKLRQPALAPQLGAYIEWRRAIERARAEGKPDPAPPDLAPMSINLDLTTACNYRCTHCIDWDILNTRHKFREAELRDSLALMAERGLRSVILIGGGEPTLFPGFAGFVEFLKTLGLQVAIVTNGSRGQVLVDAAAHLGERDWIRLSLDSGSNELFAKMHRPTSRTLDLDAICEWIPKIKAAAPSVKVGFSYIIVWEGASREEHEIHENIHEIVMAAERAKRYGFDYIAFKPVLERRPDGSEVMDPAKSERETDDVVARIRGEVDRAKQLADDRFAVYESINLRVLEEGSWRELTHQPRTCHMQALRQVLSPTGLYNCPAHRGVPKAQISGPNAYRDEWAAEKTGTQLLRILDDFDASHECREVTCLYHGVNWWLEELIQDPDLGVEVGDERLDYFL
jgi:wyosine [tRNA(Phe)-imidazoG37] synthetase (radical SAM superfamily)